MSFKTRLIIKLGFLYAFAAALLLLGYGRDNNFFTMGTTMAMMAVIFTVRFALLLKNGEKLAALETDSHDERTVFVSMKSYSFAFWLSIVAEAAAFFVLEWRGSAAARPLCFVICFQAFAYLGSYLFFNKKY